MKPSYEFEREIRSCVRCLTQCGKENLIKELCKKCAEWYYIDK